MATLEVIVQSPKASRTWLAIVLIVGCGSEGDNNKRSGSSANLTKIPRTAVCKKPTPPSAELKLQSDVDYTRDLFPIMQRACSRCHAGSIEDRQNSTNCYYLKDNIDNVLARLDNAIAAEALRQSDPTLTAEQIASTYPTDAQPMPPSGNDRMPLSASEIALFRSFATSASQCQDTGAGPILADIPLPNHYTSDNANAVSENIEALFNSAACREDASVSSDERWELVADLLQEPHERTSAFYNFASKKYVEHAEAYTSSCDYASMRQVFAGVSAAYSLLRDYENDGWRLLQCASVKSLPMLGLVKLSQTVNSLGDVMVGVNYKTISFEAQP